MRGCVELLVALATLIAGCGKVADRTPAGGKAVPRTTGAPSKSAEEFWNDWRRAVATADGKALWQMTCSSSRQAIVSRTRAALATTSALEWGKLETLTGVAVKDLQALPAESLAETVTVALFTKLRDQPGELDKAEKSTLVGSEADGGRARLRFRLPDGREMSLALTLENDAWKADLDASEIPGGRK